ncbi:MAG: sulfur carrier protein ThiS [Actinomycetes bacterium]
MTVTVTVNGRPRPLDMGATVADAVAEVAPGRERGVAVAVNGSVVPRADWAATVLVDHDRVEVLTAVAGG